MGHIIVLSVLVVVYVLFGGFFYYLAEKRQTRHPEYPELTYAEGVYSFSPARPWYAYLVPTAWARGLSNFLHELYSV